MQCDGVKRQRSPPTQGARHFLVFPQKGQRGSTTVEKVWSRCGFCSSGQTDGVFMKSESLSQRFEHLKSCFLLPLPEVQNRRRANGHQSNTSHDNVR